MSTLGDMADVKSAFKFLLHMCNLCGRNVITEFTSAASPKLDISSSCNLGQKGRVSLPQLICSLRRYHHENCVEVIGIPGGTYELLCIIRSLKFWENYLLLR